VPRRGLDAARVAEAAAGIADRDGLAGVTLARVAGELGVRSPSLYHHVAGHDALVRLVGLRAVDELATVLRDAAVGRAGTDALLAAARAYRAYALEHPGRYAATVTAPRGDPELEAAAARVVGVLVAVLRGFGLEGDDAVHAVRALRAAVHGFVALETGGGFGLPLDLDASFERLVGLLADGLARPPAGSSHAR
jgi:AcrR family transcriptional regulator